MSNYVIAMIGIVLFVVVLMVFMPIANALISEMTGFVSAPTILLITTIPLILIIGAIYKFINDSQGQNDTFI